jgi:hypothetical protein
LIRFARAEISIADMAADACETMVVISSIRALVGGKIRLVPAGIFVTQAKQRPILALAKHSFAGPGRETFELLQLF